MEKEEMEKMIAVKYTSGEVISIGDKVEHTIRYYNPIKTTWGEIVDIKEERFLSYNLQKEYKVKIKVVCIYDYNFNRHKNSNFKRNYIWVKVSCSLKKIKQYPYDVSGSLINESWRVVDMEEMYDYINKDKEQKTFIKPKFPTRRWGQVYTKTSTTDVKQIDIVLNKLKEEGFDVRKKLEKKNHIGKFYQIEINNHTDRLTTDGKALNKPRCHSFWHRECENRNKECYRCDKWY